MGAYTFRMIEIPLTPEEFAAKASQLAATQGIVLTGNHGEISKSGVKASYDYADGQLTIHILEKPFIVSTAYCEEQIKAWLTR